MTARFYSPADLDKLREEGPGSTQLADTIEALQDDNDRLLTAIQKAQKEIERLLKDNRDVGAQAVEARANCEAALKRVPDASTAKIVRLCATFSPAELARNGGLVRDLLMIVADRLEGNDAG